MQQTRGPNQLRCWCIETAVMLLFGPSRRRDARMHFLGTHHVPLVQTYIYLRAVLQQNLDWKENVDQILARGERRLAACLSWTATSSEHLPVCFTQRICLFNTPFSRSSRVRQGLVVRRQRAVPC